MSIKRSSSVSERVGGLKRGRTKCAGQESSARAGRGEGVVKSEGAAAPSEGGFETPQGLREVCGGRRQDGGTVATLQE